MQPEASDLRTDGGRVPAEKADFQAHPHPLNGRRRKRPATQAAKRLLSEVGQLKEYALYYVAAKVDGIKASMRNAAIFAALGMLGAIFACAVLVTTAVLLLVGLSGAFAALYHSGRWLGDLTVAVLVLILIGVGTWLMLKKMAGASLRRAREKYEHRKHEERARYGNDVVDCANAARAEDVANT